MPLLVMRNALSTYIDKGPSRVCGGDIMCPLVHPSSSSDKTAAFVHLKVDFRGEKMSVTLEGHDCLSCDNMLANPLLLTHA